MRKMKALIGGLEWSAASTWAGYEEATPYEQQQTAAKVGFIYESAGRAQARTTAVDAGANADLFTKILATNFQQTIGVGFDPGAIDALDAETKRSKIENLTPLVIDIANPHRPSAGRAGSGNPSPTGSARIPPRGRPGPPSQSWGRNSLAGCCCLHP